jgi:hypothetical protein
MDWMLDDFGVDLVAKTALLKNVCAELLAEFKADTNLMEQLRGGYRQERTRLAALLERAPRSGIGHL